MTELLTGKATPAAIDLPEAVPAAVDLSDFTATLPAVLVRRGALNDAWLSAEDRAWLAGDDPEPSRLAALLHTEVTHDGACYTKRSVVAAAAGLVVATGCDLSYGAGHFIKYGHFNLLPTLAAAGLEVLMPLLCILAAVAWHALWHRDEAPWIHNVVIEDETFREVRDGH